jgi:hypothetical protein
MNGGFHANLDILPPPQRALWDELKALPEEFVLYGGTAIALHLGHRQSVDFDFFGSRPFNPAHLAERIPFLAGAAVTQQAPNTLSATGGPPCGWRSGQSMAHGWIAPQARQRC